MRATIGRGVLLVIAAALAPACTTTGQLVVPRVLSAHMSMTANDPNFTHFVSNKDHELEIIPTPGGQINLRIVGKQKADPAVPASPTLIELEINITSGVTLAPATYNQSQGTAVVGGFGGNWSTAHTQNLTVEFTQLDLSRLQASGNFRFQAKKSSGDPDTLHVWEGAFLFLEIDDKR